MKVLVYTASSLCNPQFGIQMEHAIQYAKEGKEVVFCHCGGVMSACSANINRNAAICNICKIGFKAGLDKLPKGVRVEKLNRADNNSYQNQNFQSVSDIKSYKYKGVEVGFSVLSVYITKTRNPRPDITNSFLKVINDLIREAIYLIDAAERLIELEKPDMIILFNGRFFDTKPFYSLAVNKGIDFIVSENIGGIRANEEYRMVTFYNNIPHDARVIFENIIASWNKSSKSEKEKINIGSSFYERRKKGVRAGDYAYTSYQELGKLPDNFDFSKKNIVFFTSSEDEFSSVSSEVDDYYIFASQYDAVKYMAENLECDNYHIYVRIHPNMRGLNVQYHIDLYKLSEYKNVTIIAPEDTISSYALLEVAYNIATFGSTIGAESMYWGKPLVLLGFADYYFWNCCHVARNQEDVIDMLKKPVVFPSAKDMAIKYGYYFLENGLAEKSKHIKITPSYISVLGKKVLSFEYLTILGSSNLFRYIQTFYNRFISRFYKDRIVF